MLIYSLFFHQSIILSKIYVWDAKRIKLKLYLCLVAMLVVAWSAFMRHKLVLVVNLKYK